MLAIRDHLQNIFGVDRNSCDVGFDGQPKPVAGELYIAVYPGTWQGDHGAHDLDEYFGVNVTVSRRLGAVPMDRWGSDILDKALDGLEAVCRQINQAIHKNYTLMQIANSVYLGNVSAPPSPFAIFSEVLSFNSAGNPELKGPDWFSAPDLASEFEQTWAYSGVAQTLAYVRARRTQQIFPQVYLAPPNWPFTNPVTTPYVLPPAQEGVSYVQALSATGGRDDITDSYNFALAPTAVWPGALPAGLVIEAGGAVFGAPAARTGSATPYIFRVSATDPTGFVGYQVYSLLVNP